MQTALRAEIPVPIEEVIRELETAKELPKAALSAAVARADEIEPAVVALVESAAAGALLLPAECKLVLFGVHALAAARRTALYRPLVRMMRAVPDDDIEWMFDIDSGRTLPPILLSTFDGDASPLIEAAMDPAADGSTRWILWVVLARLTFDGSVGREEMKALLERFERENLAKPDNLAWKGWQEAIVLLGFEELRERMRATWADGRNIERKVDQDANDEALSEACAAAPGDAKRFDEQFLAPLGDPMDALSRFQWADPDPGAPTIQDNLASPLSSLDRDEARWMDLFLERRFFRAAQGWEAVDGFCCAIAVKPPLAAVPDVSMSLDLGFGVKFDSPAQAAFVNTLLTRYLGSLTARLAAGHLHRPLIADADHLRAGIWAACFLRAVAHDAKRWKSDNQNSPRSLMIATLVHLLDRSNADKPSARRMRDDIVDVLPLALRSLYESARGLGDPLAKPRRASDFGVKVGRNDPCPCSSGKKFKRCCGGADRPN
jgi:hypothetical protein